MAFEKSFEVRWSDCDPHRHVRHSAYQDYATHVRYRFLLESSFDPDTFETLGFGPVILREEADYLREVRLNEELRIDMLLAGISPEGTRWKIRHNVYKQDGTTAAVLTLFGGWLDLRARKLMRPPENLVHVFDSLERTSDFAPLPEITRRP